MVLRVSSKSEFQTLIKQISQDICILPEEIYDTRIELSSIRSYKTIENVPITRLDSIQSLYVSINYKYYIIILKKYVKRPTKQITIVLSFVINHFRHRRWNPVFIGQVFFFFVETRSVTTLMHMTTTLRTAALVCINLHSHFPRRKF